MCWLINQVDSELELLIKSIARAVIKSVFQILESAGPVVASALGQCFWPIAFRSIHFVKERESTLAKRTIHSNSIVSLAVQVTLGAPAFARLGTRLALGIIVEHLLHPRRAPS